MVTLAGDGSFARSITDATEVGNDATEVDIFRIFLRVCNCKVPFYRHLENNVAAAKKWLNARA
ncbi:hypothetical protein OAM67_01275 [bacterium]|nr:hypothetical protein [bacterium]